MPDWFYRTVTQPLFFRMPAVRARDFALGFMSRLARLPFGPAAIDFLGHIGVAEALAAANPRLVPLVAHDRATFGAGLSAETI